MSLIARHFESVGLPTLILGSALDILTAGRPPRAQFVNYPLGFEAGRFRDKSDQLEILSEALRGFDEMTEPGIDLLPFEWPEGWAMLTERENGQQDSRSARTTDPQYQSEEDRLAAENAAQS
ncbi:MAG: hypothetical protein HOC70_14170 [Gammaproteobacteria bacterium]|mgnify:FL=1|nr:hypothetical protein [Gammaproteobacteria bacterium]MBT4494384.1 hypothetical protein [Gammaproteobacteria bacterium]MBT7371086.1 hypothetical protein [Gammaproteobacteria bacterium]